MDGLLQKPTCSDSGLIILASAAILAILTGCFLLSLIFKLMNENRSLRSQVNEFRELQSLMMKPKVIPTAIPINANPSSNANHETPKVTFAQRHDESVLKYSITDTKTTNHNGNHDHENRYSLATGTISRNSKGHKTPVQASVPQLPHTPAQVVNFNENPGLEDSFETVDKTATTQTNSRKQSPGFSSSPISQNNFSNNTTYVEDYLSPNARASGVHNYDHVPTDGVAAKNTEPRLNFSEPSPQVVYANIMTPGMQPVRNASSLKKKPFWQRF